MTAPFDGKRFRNLSGAKRPDPATFLRWQTGRQTEMAAIPHHQLPRFELPVVEPDWAAIEQPSNHIQATWLGHAGFLVQMGGLNILTDPVFSQRCSPSQRLGPTRLTPAPINVAQLPRIDIVLISHNHYDHLDENTLLALQRLQGKQPHYYVPLRLSDWFKKRGIDNVTELDWWQQAQHGPLQLTCAPCEHFSGRGLHDTNKTLWASWAISSAEQRCYFGGDTGYGACFKDIGQRLGPFDLALLPIGAYYPRFLFATVHISPKEAVQIHQDVGARQSIAMHWGTFKLTAEPMAEPPVYLRQCVRNAGLAKNAFITCNLGETLLVKKAPDHEGV